MAVTDLKVSYRKRGTTNFSDGYRLLPITKWDYVEGKPSTYTPATHGHDPADIDDFEGAVEAISPSGSRPASDVSTWAKAANKPTYNYTEVGAAASSHSHSYDNYNGWDLQANGGTVNRITSGENVNFIEGTGIDVALSGASITISQKAAASTTLGGLKARVSGANLYLRNDGGTA